MSPNRVAWLSPDDPPGAFPAIGTAMREPDGLLAAGGDLSVERLVYAYSHGIFPWFDEGQPILWWSPDPRCVLRIEDFHTSRRLRRTLATSGATLTFNKDFGKVIRRCAGPRRSEQGTWITGDMILAYEALHAEGWAHSVEIRQDGALIGGMYGLAIDHVFFGESMYSDQANASKLAMLGLCEVLGRNGVEMIDCQVISGHLMRLGATAVSRTQFAAALQSSCKSPLRFTNWPESPLPVRNLRPR
jgi:leucyl/phenylalanyl-tRNA--protein transferase